MKKLVSFIAIAAMVVAVGCKTTAKGKNGVEYTSAVQYNDYIVNKQKDVMTAVLEFSKESDPSKIETIVDATIPKIQSAITDIEGMPEWKGNAAMRDNALALFRFYKDIFGKDYKEIIGMQKDGEISAEEETRINSISSGISSRETKLDADFKKAQQDFAKANNMLITENSMQKDIDKLGDK